MRFKLAVENREAEELLPPGRPDGSRVGVNYVDAYLKPLSVKLENGPQVSCRRRGLKLTFQAGDREGTGLLRRLENGPDPRKILRAGLEEAVNSAGVSLIFESGEIFLEMD
jgi:hypothetical protein